ncbi:penicillopepsin [Podospora australis]|uniref:Penicillopepsin n=1 Tax=Podospora australis TaxID=1536484 RepID=A0AAN6WUX8_9PEZI|nr:penicillopepsin [Podospora australis]
MSFPLLTLFVFGLFTPWVSAVPSGIQKQSFKVERVRNEEFRGHNGPRQLLKAYRKYGLPISPELVEAVNLQEEERLEELQRTDLQRRAMFKSKRPRTNEKGTSSGIVAARPESGDIEFLSPITIGGQTITVDFDSGSADLWVFSSQLSPRSVVGHQVYDHTKSSTFSMIPDQNFAIKYGDGSTASGNVGTDTVEVGGVTVTGQAVEMATSVSTSFINDVPNNGMLGLAFSKLNQVTPTQQKTFFENVMPSLAEPVWTADLRKGQVGAYEFGRIDHAKYTGDLTWIPSNTTRGFWKFDTSGFSVGSSTAPLKQISTGHAIADTGTTLMLVAKEVSDAYWEQVPGAKFMPTVGGIAFPCNSTLPDLFIDVGGAYAAKVRGHDINFTTLKNGFCYGGVQPTPSKLQIWGNVFFRSQFVVFNGGNHSLGMAPHV